MRLRKQLLLVSLFTLALPWAGCEYVREMEQTLQAGQTQALAATATAVAGRLGSEPMAVNLFTDATPPPGTYPVYAHQLGAPAVVDGYEDEWLAAGYAMQGLTAPGGERAQLIAGFRGDRLYLFLRSFNRLRQYFHPSQNSPLITDHLRLHVRGADGTRRTLVVYASGPGRVTVERLVENNRRLAEHRVQGQWLEWPGGYHLELALPLEWSERALGVALHHSTDNDASLQARISNFAPGATLPPLLKPEPRLEAELSVFSRPGVQLHLASVGARRLASHGSLRGTGNNEQPHGLVSWFYRLALGNGNTPQLDSPVASGRFETPEISLALSADEPGKASGEVASGLYERRGQRLLRVAVPVYATGSAAGRAGAGPIIGVVVADQSADSLTGMTNSAFDRLIAYSLGAVLLAALVLILYASWLSTRIRRLSRAAGEAVSETGKIADSFPVLASRDEVGDLSRSFSQLLARLREYTHYLRTLSSKLSHELRTPLAIVRSSLDNLDHVELSKEARVYAERAREGTSRLSGILNSMSAASRVEQAISGTEMETIPLDQILENLKAAYEDVYPQVTFRLNLRRDEGPLQVRGSGELLVQMLDKLVDNAADFCPESGLIELGLYRTGNTVVITVRNEGPPLPSHMHGQLFDSMVSVRDKSDDSHHLGLGLYIVRLIVDFHRGEVQGYNVPDNSGVIFEVRLPASAR